MRKIFGIILGLTLILGAYKKGENDSLVSLRSRKTRLVNTWVLKSYKINSKEQISNNISGELSLLDNGKYFYSLLYKNTGFVKSHSGTWDFLLKSEKFKDKELLICSAIGIDLPFIYEILGLRNNQIQLKLISKTGDSSTIEEWCYKTKKE